MNAAAIVMVLTHARILTPVHGWHPAGGLIEDALTAARGHSTLTAEDCRRLQSWATTWEKVPSDLAKFYEANAHEACMGAVLWHVFEGYARPTGARYGQLVKLWVEQHGHNPPFSLIHSA